MPAPPDALRLGTWNIEWFSNLFDTDDRMLEDDAPSARYGVTRRQQLAAIGIVMAAMDLDALMIIEAPDDGRRRSCVRALEGFAEACGLRTSRALIGFPSQTEQEIALLYDPARVSARHDPRDSEAAPRFDGDFLIDLDIDGQADRVTFSRPPLELVLTPANGLPLRMIGVHCKSKAPHGARTAADVARLGIENRRKQLAQCVWLRRRIDDHLRAGDPVIVLGDLNDGPGLDGFEALFNRSGVEVVLGLDGPPDLHLHDPHARSALHGGFGALPATARFYLHHEGRYFSALLDYVMLSPDLAARGPRWRIWHPFDDPKCWANPDLRDALLAASDHFPVTLDLVM